MFVSSTSEPQMLGPGLLLGADPIGLSQVIDAPEPRQAPEGLVLSSMRNQLTVTITPDTLVFGDGSGNEPARKDFPRRVSLAAEFIRSMSKMTYAAIGLNFDIEAEPVMEELPSKSILRRLVKEDTLEGTDYGAIGASVRLWYAARDRRYDLRIEPRGNQYDSLKYYAHLNVHILIQGAAPSEEWTSEALNEEYEYFKKVLEEVLNR